MTAPSEGKLIELLLGSGLDHAGHDRHAPPHDVLGMGFPISACPHKIIDYERKRGFPVIPSFKGLLEVSYTEQIMRGLMLQPDFQYFRNPAAIPGPIRRIPTIAIPNTAVFGLRTTVNY